MSAHSSLSECCGCCKCRCPASGRFCKEERLLEQELLEQKQVLEQQMQQLTDAIRFCGELAKQHPQMERLDVDACLNRMEQPEKPGGFFAGWLEDYRAVAKTEGRTTRLRQGFTAAFSLQQRKPLSGKSGCAIGR